MKELYCFSCGAKDPTFEELSWILQFNGLLCPECNKNYPAPDVERTPITPPIDSVETTEPTEQNG
jgi:hypothetical protein